MLGQHKRAVGVFSNYRDAEVALTELKNSGFSMDNVSVVARDADKGNDIAGADVSDRVGNKADEGAKAGAVTGGTLGGLTGLLVGLGALAIPGLGPVMLAGAAGTAIATTLSGGAIGAAAGSLLGALIGLGIPEERARHYSDRVSRGDYLVMVDGSDDDIRRAEAILSHRGIQDWGIYDAPATNATTTTTTRTSDIADPSGTYQTPVVDPTPRTDSPVQIIDRREQTL
ncbi:general stress protein [Coleofasciculus sp. FACHB-SPT36]|uniref:general stress protein n=1 Tax=Cyanophyceae TaxID=3028117 RepID=UPI001F556E94|nr:general stress protein [Coleofasciculus sp. FACHB-SPT36]